MAAQLCKGPASNGGGSHPPASRSDSEVKTLLDKYVASLRFRRLSPKTIENYRWNLALLERQCGKHFTDSLDQGELTAADVWELLEERVGDLSQAYLRQIVSTAKSWHKWGNSRELWPLNGIISIPTPPKEDGEPHPLPPSQILWLLINAWTDAQRKMLLLGGWQGCRIAESATMDGPNWLDDRLSFVGKRSKRREVPLAPMLLEYREIVTRAYTLRQMRWAYEALRARAPFAWTPHQLRDTFAQRHLDNGVELVIVESLLGHAPTSTTLRSYAGAPWERKVAAQRNLKLL